MEFIQVSEYRWWCNTNGFKFNIFKTNHGFFYYYGTNKTHFGELRCTKCWDTFEEAVKNANETLRGLLK